MHLITALNSPFLPLWWWCSFSAKWRKKSPFVEEGSSSESAEPALATRLHRVGARLKLLECRRQNGNFVTKHGLHPPSESASPQSEFKGERESRRKQQLVLFADNCLLSVATFELECLFFFWSMKLFIRIVFPFLCKYIYFDVK